MPRTVNFSDNNDRRDKKKAADEPGDSRFFGLKFRLSQTAKAASPAELPPSLPVEAVDTAPAPTETATASIEEPIAEVVSVLESVPPPASLPAFVNDVGEVDFERLFEAVGLPGVAVSAERASQILTSLPAELPFHVKKILVKTTLNMMSELGTDPAVSATIVADAAQKMLWIARLQKSLSDAISQTRVSANADIEALEAQIAERKASLAAAEAATDTALRHCIQRMTKLHDVTVFFDGNNDGGNDSEVPARKSLEAENEETPAFLDEKSVFRLLGISSGLTEENAGISPITRESYNDRPVGLLRHRIANPST